MRLLNVGPSPKGQHNEYSKPNSHQYFFTYQNSILAKAKAKHFIFENNKKFPICPQLSLA